MVLICMTATYLNASVYNIEIGQPLKISIQKRFTVTFVINETCMSVKAAKSMLWDVMMSLSFLFTSHFTCMNIEPF